MSETENFIHLKLCGKYPILSKSNFAIFYFRVLPSMVKLPEESALDFSKRVQQTMAKAMGLIPTMFTFSDKYELIKELRTSATHSG